MIKRILVGITGGAATDAKIAMSLDMAQRHGAALTILSVVDISRLTNVGPAPIGAGIYARRLGETRVEQSHARDERAIAAFEAAAGEAGVPLQVLRTEADPLASMIAAWRTSDLCLLDARGWFDQGIMPEPDNALLKLVAAGVRPLVAVAEQPRQVRKVIVAYNGSLDSAKAMKHFVQLRIWPEASLEVICVGATKSGEAAEPMLAAAAGYCRDHGFQATTRRIDGDTIEGLLSHAETSGADLLVLGSSFRTILLLRRFGRHAIALLDRARLPLFLSH